VHAAAQDKRVKIDEVKSGLKAHCMSELVLGIDLGTTHSAVGLVDSGFAILLADENGHRITPSAVYVGTDGTLEIGAKALRHRALEPERVITSVKRLIGRRSDEIEADYPLQITVGSDGMPRVLGKTAEQISAQILGEMKRIAEWRMGTKITKAVITVPAYFHDAQRTATKHAAELAGLEVLRIINEPTAAALAYGLDKLTEKSRVAVYDLGGGTFDLSILEIQEGVFQVIATHGDTRLGGDDLDALIVTEVLRREAITEVSAATRIRLLEVAERLKQALSSATEAIFRLPFYDESRSIEQHFSREQLEQLAVGWINKTLRHCKQALADAALIPAAIDAVVLVGGSTRMPAVRRAVTELFEREPDVSQHPDEAIALGATIQGGVMSGALRQMILLDVTPLSLGIETFGGLMNVLIPRNTTIPCKAGEMFTNAADHQTAIRLRVLQGEREMARDNWQLGEFDVTFAATLKGQTRLGVQFKIDENGMLEVLARDVSTGIDSVLQIENTSVHLDDIKVQMMVNESVEHAFSDMAERVFTEAKMKADELLHAIASLMKQGLVLETERGEIELAVTAVQNALSSNAANPLKAAVQRLDSATEVLAARLTEQAMDAALERKLA
jgi:molecular chaperone DnaK